MKNPLLKITFALALGAFGLSAIGAETVKVGVLHSLSGTMAISETSLKDVLLFTFDEINAKGGDGPQDRAGRCGPCLKLAVVRRESRAVDRKGQVRRRVR